MSGISPNQRGILAITASMTAYTVNDALVKEIARHYPVGEVIFIRGVFTVLILATVVFALRQTGAMRRAISRPVVYRSLFDGISSACFVLALVQMKLADIAAVLQAMPLIVSALAVVVYREVVGWRGWTAILVGFAGALFVVKPTPEAFNVWALFALGAATSSALREVQTRRIDRSIPSTVVALFGSICITLVGACFMPFEIWRMPAVPDVAVLAGAAVFVAMATYFMTIAFRGVDISVVAPFRYSYLLTAAIAGYIAFNEIPDLWSVLGAALIVASGIYTLRRETLRRRALAATAIPAA